MKKIEEMTREELVEMFSEKIITDEQVAEIEKNKFVEESEHDIPRYVTMLDYRIHGFELDNHVVFCVYTYDPK